jgi:predicted phosphodiesterase
MVDRIAVVSDIHGNLPALEAVADGIERAGAEVVVNLGDIASGPLWPAETVRWLAAQAWITIAGNHERQVLGADRAAMGPSDAFAAAALGPAERSWLGALPAGRRLAPDVLLCHGTPGSDLVYLLETVTPGLGLEGSPGVRAAGEAEVRGRLGDAGGATLVLCGHSHVPRVVAVPGGPLVVNPGSVGLQAYDGDYPAPHRVENGSPVARWALVARCGEGWRVEQHAVPYDAGAAADRAAENGRRDWEVALRTGRMGRG